MKIDNEVYELISRHCSKKPEVLSDDLFLEQDLKMVGDDIVDLLEEMQAKFDIDFSNFDFSLHFSPEVGWPENPEYGYYPVTVGHLVKVATGGIWFLPEKNKENFLVERRRTLVFKTVTVSVTALFILVFILLGSHAE